MCIYLSCAFPKQPKRVILLEIYYTPQKCVCHLCGQKEDKKGNRFVSSEIFFFFFDDPFAKQSLFFFFFLVKLYLLGFRMIFDKKEKESWTKEYRVYFVWM